MPCPGGDGGAAEGAGGPREGKGVEVALKNGENARGLKSAFTALRARGAIMQSGQWLWMPS